MGEEELEGFDESIFDQVSEENKALRNKNLDLTSSMVGSNFNSAEEPTLIHYQLETEKILERIEHFLRGDKIKVRDGDVYYETPKDKKLINFNEYGVAELMRIISMYVTKETFLSNYEEERINEILADLGDALADFLYCNYENMGMDTKFKQTKFTLIVLNILHTIESCYRRALGGEEMKGLRQRAIVTQHSPMGNQMGGMGGIGPIRKKKWHPFKRDTW